MEATPCINPAAAARPVQGAALVSLVHRYFLAQEHSIAVSKAMHWKKITNTNGLVETESGQAPSLIVVCIEFIVKTLKLESIKTIENTCTKNRRNKSAHTHI